MSVYDEDLGLGPVRWKGEQPRDFFKGIVTKVTRLEGTRFDKEKVGLAFEVEFPDGAVVEWVAWNAYAKRQLEELRPEVGDTLQVTFEGIDPAAPDPARAARLYQVGVPARGSDIPFEGAGAA